jgi:hypothetical protein
LSKPIVTNQRSYPVLTFCYGLNMKRPSQVHVLNVQLVELFWEVVETLAGGSWLGEVGHWGHWKFTWFPVPSLCFASCPPGGKEPPRPHAATTMTFRPSAWGTVTTNWTPWNYDPKWILSPFICFCQVLGHREEKS